MHCSWHFCCPTPHIHPGALQRRREEKLPVFPPKWKELSTIFFLPNVKPSVLARATMIMVCFVVTHSFFHCFGCSYTVGHALKCQLRRPLGHSETRMGFKRGTFVQISSPPQKKNVYFALCWQDRLLYSNPDSLRVHSINLDRQQ